MALVVNVTQKHIEKGVPGDPCYCPIALAVKEKCPDKDVLVDGWYIYVTGVGLYKLPLIASTFVDTFDGGGSVEPLSFTAIEDDDY